MSLKEKIMEDDDQSMTIVSEEPHEEQEMN
jgi:hypothetical protein